LSITKKSKNAPPKKKTYFEDLLSRAKTLARENFTLKKLFKQVTIIGLITVLIAVVNLGMDYFRPYYSTGTAHFEKAVDAYNRQDYEEAEQFFLNTKNTDPRLKQVDYYLGLIQRYKYKDRLKSLKYFSKVGKDDPKYAAAQKELVWYYFEREDYPNLEKYLPNLLEANPQSVYGRLAQQAVLIKNNNEAGLEKELKKTIEYYSEIKDGLTTFKALQGSVITRFYGDKQTNLGGLLFPDTFYQQIALLQANATLAKLEAEKGNYERANIYFEQAMDTFVPIQTESKMTITLNAKDYIHFFDKSDEPVLVYSIPEFKVNDRKYYFAPLKALANQGIADYQVELESIKITSDQTNILLNQYKRLHSDSTKS
jgi:tetratricopeptide (TPR) repeat protein